MRLAFARLLANGGKWLDCSRLRRLLEGAALFLDFDGTWLSWQTPDGISVPTGLCPSSNGLKRISWPLAIVVGARLPTRAYLRSTASPFRVARARVRLADGRACAQHSLGLDECATRSKLLPRKAKTDSGRRKPPGSHSIIASHPASRRAEAFMARLARQRIRIAIRAMVTELRAHGATRRRVKAFMTEPAFAAARPIFVGDDLTDEHGFAEAAALGGAGILVGPKRTTAARYRLESVKAVADWLRSAE